MKLRFFIPPRNRRRGTDLVRAGVRRVLRFRGARRLRGVCGREGMVVYLESKNKKKRVRKVRVN